MTDQEHLNLWLLQRSPDGMSLRDQWQMAERETAQAIDRTRNHTLAHLNEQYDHLARAYEQARANAREGLLEKLGHFLHVLEVQVMLASGSAPDWRPHHA